MDPEGLLGTISSVAHVLLGFYCGKLIRQKETVEQKVLALFVVGTVLVIGGYLLTYGLPLNKRIWSPSYVMMTCGLASLLQAFLMYVIDIQKKSKWTTFFHIFGVNALALYVSSELLAILLGHLGVSEMVYNGIRCHQSAEMGIAGLCRLFRFAEWSYRICLISEKNLYKTLIANKLC